MQSSFGGGARPGDGPSAAQLESWRGRSEPPENEVPVAVPVSTVIGRADGVVVALVGVFAYTTGVSLDVAVRLRAEPRGPLRHRVFELLGNAWYGEDVGAEQRLLLGFEYADGRTATNVAARGLPPGVGREEDDPDPAEATLLPQGGGGGGRRYDQTYWLSPLPPPGPLVVVCAWSAFNIPETRTMVDGAAITGAASRAEVLWPWQPEDEAEEHPEPRLPAGGWFANAVRRRRPG